MPLAKGLRSGSHREPPPVGARPGRRYRWRRRRSGGVSEVVATILLLGLTVTLFAAIFAFVTRFPAPPAQDVNQFQASVVQNASGITQLNILQSSGPTVTPGANVILQASSGPHNWQFTRAGGVPVPWGMGNSTAGWSTGQTWTTVFSPALHVPVNITIYILTSSALLFTGVVPGYSSYVAPFVVSTFTLPSAPAIGQAFSIFAVISGNTTGLAANVTVSGIPGLSSYCSPACSLTYNSTEKAWGAAISGSETTTAGTYYAYVQGQSSATGATVSGSVLVTITGSSTSTLSASVAVNPSPPTVRTNATLTATVSDSGSTSATVSNVTYWVNYSANNTNVKTLYAASPYPTVGAYSSVAVTSPVWMVPPKAQAAANLTVLVKFSNGYHAVGASTTTFGAPPYAVAVSAYAQNATLKANTTWDVLVTVANSGSLGGNKVNVTVYANYNASNNTTEGKILSPYGGLANPGYATPAGGSILAASTTDSFVAQFRPSTTHVLNIILRVVVKVTNSGSWTAFSSTIVLRASTTFTT